jgi:type VI protein secretion system component Hcp
MAWFLKLDGHPGESQEQKDCINLLNWSFGATLSVAHTGTTAGQVQGQAEVHDVNVSLVTDKSFVEMWKSVCNGNPIKESVILGTKSVAGTEKAKPFFKLTMNDCYISSAQLSGSGEHGADALDPPSFSIKFNKMKIEYTEYDKKGAQMAQPKMEFDMGEHKVS